jgi:hypothetical protein
MLVGGPVFPHLHSEVRGLRFTDAAVLNAWYALEVFSILPRSVERCHEA